MTSRRLFADRRRFRSGDRWIIGLELVVLATLLLAWNILPVRPPDVLDYAFWIIATLTLAFSAMTQTLPILAGGQGLAAGSTAYLVSVIVASAPIDGTLSALLWIGAGLLAGGAIGAINGVLIGYLRVPSTAVTLSTAIMTGGLAQIIASRAVPAPPAEALSVLLFGWSIAGFPLVLLVAVALAAVAIEALRLSDWGHGLRLLGMRPGLAERMGVPSARLRASAYAIAGLGSAATGIIMAAQLGAADLQMATPLLLQVYAAVALGGSIPGLRGGSVTGSLIGAAIVTATSNILLPLGMDDYISTAFDAMWLVAGIVLCRLAAGHNPADAGLLTLQPPKLSHRGFNRLASSGLPRLAIGVVAALAIFGHNPSTDLAVVTLGMAVLALGQGAVMRAGGLDMSMPAMIAFAGMATVTLTQGSSAGFPMALAVIACAAVVTGLFHGLFAWRFNRVSIVASIATAGVLQVLMAWLSVNNPPGFAPPELARLLTSDAAPDLWTGLFSILLMALCFDLWRKPDVPGRNAPLAVAYMVSSVCAAAFGVGVALFAGQYHAGLGDIWLTPVLAAVVMGGVPFRGGAGTLVGVIGGVLMSQALDTMLVAAGLGVELRLMIFGFIMLALSLVTARRREAQMR